MTTFTYCQRIRQLLYYSSVYILTDISLEIANKNKEKQYWHHILASTMGAGIVSNAAGLSVVSSLVLGTGIGIITLPIYYSTYTLLKIPSLYQQLSPKTTNTSSDTPDAATSISSLPNNSPTDTTSSPITSPIPSSSDIIKKEQSTKQELK